MPPSVSTRASRESGQPRKPDSRLPRWTWGLIVAGGALGYLGVGMLLEGRRFWPKLDGLWQDPGGFAGGGAEVLAPLVLLLVPAVLAGIWTRDTLRVVFTGLRRGDPPLIIAKDVAVYAISFVILILLGLTTSSKRDPY
jgi:hypothetical protein